MAVLSQQPSGGSRVQTQIEFFKVQRVSTSWLRRAGFDELSHPL
ncbi:MAG: hypothetical protein PHX39_04530 [Bacteroidales bacterium]|nr:hypothetical protein [Bacteroidales bacterium]